MISKGIKNSCLRISHGCMFFNFLILILFSGNQLVQFLQHCYYSILKLYAIDY